MATNILVTGATGSVGGAIVQALVQRQLPVRAAARNPRTQDTDGNVESVKFDYALADSVDAALTDVTGLFLLAPPMDANAPDKLIPVIARAKEKGVGHIVFLSAFGADQNEQSPLRRIERALMASGVPSTIVRPNFFMENFSTGSMAATIKQQRGIFLAAGTGRTSFISTHDIAAVVAAAFAEHLTGQEFNLTGPEALDHAEVAALIGAALGTTVAYHDLPELDMLQGARASGMPESSVQYLAALYSAVRAGYAAPVTGDVRRITGRSPVSFGDFVKANQARW